MTEIDEVYIKEISLITVLHPFFVSVVSIIYLHQANVTTLFTEIQMMKVEVAPVLHYTQSHGSLLLHHMKVSGFPPSPGILTLAHWIGD
jgi:hypothetical protein